MQQIRIDFDNPGLPQSLGAVEGESQSRIFQAALYKSGAAYTAPAGAVYSIMYRGFGPRIRAGMTPLRTARASVPPAPSPATSSPVSWPVRPSASQAI